MCAFSVVCVYVCVSDLQAADPSAAVAVGAPLGLQLALQVFEAAGHQVPVQLHAVPLLSAAQQLPLQTRHLREREREKQTDRQQERETSREREGGRERNRVRT